MSEADAVHEALGALAVLTRMTRYVRELELRIDALVAEVARLEDDGREATTAQLREAYRRGYHTGHGAGRRGRPEHDRPDDHARGRLAELFARVDSAERTSCPPSTVVS